MVLRLNSNGKMIYLKNYTVEDMAGFQIVKGVADNGESIMLSSDMFQKPVMKLNGSDVYPDDVLLINDVTYAIVRRNESYVAVNNNKILHLDEISEGTNLGNWIEYPFIYVEEENEKIVEDDSNAIYTIFTDGSCLSNPNGAGGYAAVILKDNEEYDRVCGGEDSTTNNRMELLAVIKALETLGGSNKNICIMSDSQYVCNGYVKGWVSAWKRNDWHTSSGAEVQNKSLWIMLDNLVATHNVTFRWVKGHNGNKYNEICDELAFKEAMKHKRVG